MSATRWFSLSPLSCSSSHDHCPASASRPGSGELRVDREQSPAVHRHGPAVGPDQVSSYRWHRSASTVKSPGAPGHGLSPMSWLPGIACHGTGSRSSCLAAIVQVASAMRSVEGEIAKVDDDVGGVRANVAEHGIPVGCRFRRGRREASVRHQDHTHRSHTCTVPAVGAISRTRSTITRTVFRYRARRIWCECRPASAARHPVHRHRR